jgi:hypothetical protein
MQLGEMKENKREVHSLSFPLFFSPLLLSSVSVYLSVSLSLSLSLSLFMEELKMLAADKSHTEGFLMPSWLESQSHAYFFQKGF